MYLFCDRIIKPRITFAPESVGRGYPTSNNANSSSSYRACGSVETDAGCADQRRHNDLGQGPDHGSTYGVPALYHCATTAPFGCQAGTCTCTATATSAATTGYSNHFCSQLPNADAQGCVSSHQLSLRRARRPCRPADNHFPSQQHPCANL